MSSGHECARVFGSVVHANEKRVVNDTVLGHEFGIHLEHLFETNFHLMSNLKRLFLVKEVAVLERNRPVHAVALIQLDSASTVCGPFEVVPYVNLLGRLEDVVHNAEVDFLTHLALLPVEDYLVQAVHSTHQRFHVLQCDVVVIVLENLLEELEFPPGNGLEHKLCVWRVVEE